MAHVYMNEYINGDFEAYLIQYGDGVTTQKINEGIGNYFDNAWKSNPKLQSKVEKPAKYDFSVADLVKWIKQCRGGSPRFLPVATIGEDIRFYLTYAPDNTDFLTERQKDLQSRMSRLCEMSCQLQMHIEKLTDIDDREATIDALEAEYQDLFSETVRIYGG